jgi:L-alanine-DL-glutamate epimerase-like enolase superfamily enzyme
MAVTGAGPGAVVEPARVVGAVRVRVPLVRPMVTAHGAWPVCDAWLVRLADPDGRAGIGEATLGPFAGAAAQARLDGLVRALVADGSPRAAGADAGAEPGVAEAALRSAIGAARFDLAAQVGGAGPARDTVLINALIGAEEPEAAVAAARTAVAAGFGTLKLKGGGERTSEELVARLVAIRSAVGPDVGLRLDVNGAWDQAVARERLRAIADAGVGLAYVEQPVAAGRVEHTAAVLAELRRTTGGAVPIAADESVTSLAAARALLAAGAVDALVVKPARVGGPEAALAIAAAADAAGVAVTVARLLETGVGLLAARAVAARLGSLSGADRVAHGLGTGGLLTTDLVGGRSVVEDGIARADGRADGWLGLWDRLDREAVERVAVERLGAWA